ncbi:hypothetical protein ACFGB1_000278 [Proteus mirabilis]|uniref:hypothetical protein n=1 Tax=Proteus mirabilis TaxID=584 RepID=UPI0023F7D3F2|nr:hypothetical protein [Proteus mirabilis]MDF7473916.1 hypothetical protein [Proteus mirabilis]HEA4451900.1 hypothetical protein [Proteus mirabilis]
MTVSTELSHEEYVGNGVTTDFDFRFRIFESRHLIVVVADSDGNETTLKNGTDYTIVGAGSYHGGKVVLNKPLAKGWKILLERDLPVVQETDLRNQGKFFAEVHEDAFDYLTMLIQKALGTFSLSLRKPTYLSNYYDAKGNRIANLAPPKLGTDAVNKDYVDNSIKDIDSKTLRVKDKAIPALPNTDERAGKVLTFDENGYPIAIAPASGSAVDVLNELGKPNGAELIAGGALIRFKKRGSFKLGGTVNNADDALIYSNGFYYINISGEYPVTVPENSSPNEDWVCVGILNAYGLSDPLNWGVEYGTKTEQKEKFQLQMDSLSKLGGGTIWLDGWVYLKDTINVMVPDPIYVENQANYFFKVPDNITIKSKRGYNAGFRIADGVVVANQHIQYSKGFQVFSDAGRHVKNFVADGFAIDYNGKNNLLPPLSVSNPQALCPGFWFLQGEDIHIKDILHIECPGQQCVVLDYLVNRCSIKDNTFYHCGGTLKGNDNINDHSSIFCLASNYTVSGNRGIGFDGVDSSRLSNESTFIECHGQYGVVRNNMCYGYNCGAVLAAFRNDLINVVHHNNQYYSVCYGINYDATENCNFDLISHSNVVTLRSNRPTAGKYNAGHGHGIHQFASHQYPITAKLKLHSYNNEFIQEGVNPDWDGQNVGENVIFEGGKFTHLYIDDRAIGFKSGIKMNFPAGKVIDIKMDLKRCGNNTSYIGFYTSLIQLQNVDSSFNASNAERLNIDITLDSECLYTKSLFFMSPQIPLAIDSKINAVHWLGLYGGNEPGNIQEYHVKHTFLNIKEELGLEFNAVNLYGKIEVGGNTSFIKTRGNALAWNYRGFQDVYTVPISPRPFGDRRGDMITPRQFTVGQASVIVCVRDGPNSSTVGTWKGAGVISA